MRPALSAQPGRAASRNSRRSSSTSRQQRFEQLERRLVRPVQIVHHDQQRPRAGLPAQHLRDGPARHALERVRRHLRETALVGRRERQALHAQQEGQDLGREVGRERAGGLRDPCALLGFRLVVAAARPAAEQIRERVKRDVPPGRERAAEQPADAVRRVVIRELRHETRLPDARLGDELDDAAAPGVQRRERGPERAELGLASDQLGEDVALVPEPRAVHARLARAHLVAGSRLGRSRRRSSRPGAKSNTGAVKRCVSTST